MRAFVVCLLACALFLPALAEDALVTPDQPAYVTKMAQEQLDLALATDPGTRIEKLAAASDQRVRELKAALDAKQANLIAPLAHAFMRLVLEGIEPILTQSEQQGLDLTGSLTRAERLARRHPLVLEELSLQAAPEIETLFQKTLESAKRHLATLRAALSRAKKQRGATGLPDQGSDDDGVEPGTGGQEEGLGFDLGELKKPSSGGSSGDDRRSGRGD